MGKKIILVGKAASGKDYFKNYLLSKGFKTSVSHTTRPMRDEEVNGETYHFVSKYTFLTMGSSGKFFEFKKFNGWYYGTSNKEFLDSNVFIFTPGGIIDLPEDFVNECVIVYFDIEESIRINRLMKRSDSDSINRRLKADEDDFEDFSKYDILVNDHKYNCDILLDKIIRFEDKSICTP